jgi:hypothetical protein
MLNVEQFLNTQVTDANATKVVPVPEGEYTAIIGPITKDSLRSYKIKNGPRAGQEGYSLDLEWEIFDENVKNLLKRDTVKVRQSIMLDIENGTLALGEGRNISLGRVREAVNQNRAGQPWSFGMLSGQTAKIKVVHRVDGDEIYAEVRGVSRA